MQTPQDSIASLSALFSPRSIAVVGASATTSKIGGIPLDYLQRFGYEGDIHPINPRGGEIQGLPSHPTLQAIGKPVDLAIFALPSALVPAALDDAVSAGVKGIVLFSSGFAETGAEGEAAQARIAARARAAGIRILGPNCLGFMNVARKLCATFSPAPGAGRVGLGRIGLVSQSGAFGAYAYSMARDRGIGLSLWATTGNEADVQVADCLAWLAQDPATDVIMAYMEGCRDGPKLRAALALAQANRKPVVMVKVGTTALGAHAAASHTAALAGDDAVYDAVFRQYGVLRAHTMSEFFDLASSAAIAGLPRDRSIGLFTVSGGVGVLMADEAASAGLEVPALGEEAQRTLREWVPFAATRNPVDITGQVTNDLTLMERAAHLMLNDRKPAMWMGFFAAAGASDKFWPVLRGLAASLRAAHPEVLLALSTLLSPPRRAELEAMGCLVFSDPSIGIRTLAALADCAGHGDAVSLAPAAPRVRSIDLRPGVHTEADSLALLAAAGVAVAAHRVVRSTQEAEAAWEALGGDIALKVSSADIPHKSDCGGVALGLRDADQVRAAFERVQVNARSANPEARIDGVLAARMVRGGVECIAGVHRDPVFGPVLMFGLGGIHVEVLRDVSLRLLPVTRDDARAMVNGLRASALLHGVRGQPAADIESIVDALLALAAFAEGAGERLESAEINPLIACSPQEGGCVAADALVVGRA
jgi:acyl-CoA synthetase (NDP forming)